MTDQFDTAESKEAARLQKYKDEQAAELKKMRTKLLPKLRKKGVEIIVYEYTGYGDERNLEEMIFTPAMDMPKDKFQIEKVLWSVLALHFPAYETDEGGYGKITWNITTNRIKVAHEQNVMHTDSSVVEEI